MLNQRRVVIENVTPQLEGGTYFIKRVVGEDIVVTADVFSDGHDIIACCIKYKHEKERKYKEVRMSSKGNDQWEERFKVTKQGYYTYFIEGWVDYALNWQHGISRKIEDGQQVKSELLEGVEYLEKIAKEATPEEQTYLEGLITTFQSDTDYESAISHAVSKELADIFTKYPEKFLFNVSKELKVYTDREKARFSTWYEFFPRSSSPEKGKHGTFKDCERLLPRIAELGFDTLYFPPIHPIGEVNRKGKNNTTDALKDDVGSPWGIGSKHGGHMAVHPQLGSLADFKHLVKKAAALGIEVAMDYALQAAPDHPYVKEHPEWFKWRPDGTVQYAENPPKKYQDILPIYFESNDWKNLWNELYEVMLFWIESCGIKVFRVDNPHTKPYYFWGWLIHKIKNKHPDTLFLSEAFTRPKVMQQLAKQGFTQSYTYFTWRNSKEELIEYVTELTKTDQKEYFRPNFWPNTPDINPYALQNASETVFLTKYLLAATLSSNTGIYGPVFEQMVSAPMPGKEEYLDSEKYQISHWDWNVQNKLITVIRKVNQSRKELASLQQTNNILFCDTDHNEIIAYYKYDDTKEDETLTIVNLNSDHMLQAWIRLPLEAMNVHEGQPVQVQDKITGSTYTWDKEWNFVELHPTLPFHLFKITK